MDYGPFGDHQAEQRPFGGKRLLLASPPPFGQLGWDRAVTGHPGRGVPVSKQRFIGHHHLDFSRHRSRGMPIDPLDKQVSHNLTMVTGLAGGIARISRLTGIDHTMGIPGQSRQNTYRLLSEDQRRHPRHPIRGWM